MNLEQRYRLGKALVFVASLGPLVWMICGAFGWLGQSLGADPVKRLEHECGKIALNFLLFTLAVTPVRQLTGWTHLVRLRRMLGLYTFFYAALHFIVYCTLDLELNFRMVGAELVKRPYLAVGFTALVMLAILAITSTNRMMRRLGRRWQRLHRLVYVIAVLAVWHFYWQVKRDVREPLIYAGIVAILLGYRFVRSRRRAVTSRSGSAIAPERI